MFNTKTDRLPDLVSEEVKKFTTEGNLNYSNVPQLGVPVKDCQTDEEFMDGVKTKTRFRVVEDTRYSDILERVVTEYKVEKLGAKWEHVGTFGNMDGAKTCIEAHKGFTAKTRVVMVVDIEEQD